MRLEARDLLGRVQSVAETGQVKASLSVGKVFSALIVSVEGETVHLEVNGKPLQARNMSGESLLAGSSAQFEVLKSNSESIEIRPLALSGLSSAENDLQFLKQNLTKMGLSPSLDNLEILSQMMRSGTQISQQSFQEIKVDLLGVQKLADYLFSKPEENRGAPLAEQQGQEMLSALTEEEIVEALGKAPRDLMGDKASLQILKMLAESLPMPSADKEIFAAGKETPAAGKQIEGEAIPLAEGKVSAQEKSPEAANAAPETSAKVPEGEHRKGELVKTFLHELQSLNSDREILTKELVFLHKLGLKASIFHLAIAKSLLQGRVGVFAALSELLSETPASKAPSPEAEWEAKFKRLFKASASFFEAPDKMDGKGLQELSKQFKELSQELSNWRPDSAHTKSPEQAALLREYVGFQRDLQNIWQSILIPINPGKGMEDLEVYVRKDREGKRGRNASDDRILYLSLKTENIERVKVRIDYGKKELKLIFLLQSEDLSNYVKEHLPALRDSLSLLVEKKVHISVNADLNEINLSDFELATSIRPSSKIDVRI